MLEKGRNGKGGKCRDRERGMLERREERKKNGYGEKFKHSRGEREGEEREMLTTGKVEGGSNGSLSLMTDDGADKTEKKAKAAKVRPKTKAEGVKRPLTPASRADEGEWA